MSNLPYHLYNINLLTGENLSGDLNSPSININTTRSYAVQFNWTGASSPVGEVSVYGSNDDITFTQVIDSLSPVLGNSGSCLINVEFPSYGFVKVNYKRTSGSGGVVNCSINGKR
jgi:hypothetical protein